MSAKTSLVKTTPVEEEQLTLAECLHQVYEYVAASTDDDDINSIPAQDAEAPDTAYAYAQSVLELTREQVSLFAVIFELALDGRTSAGEIAKTLGVTRTKFLTFKPDLDVLKEQRYISYCSSRLHSSNFFVPNQVINSIAKGERPRPENQILTVSKFAGKLQSILRDFYLADWDFSDLSDEITYLYSHNRDNHLVKAYYAHNLNNVIPDYEQVLFSFLISKAICYSQRNFDYEDYARLFMDLDFTEIRSKIETGKLKLMQKGIIEHASEGGQVSADLIRLSENALQEYIDASTLEATGLLKKTSSTYFNLINPSEITPKELYFNDKLGEEFENLHRLLQQDNYEKVIARMREKGLNTSHAILFFGSPGTGKTEAVFQLARLTGHPIFKLCIAGIRDKFVGESERHLKEALDVYRQAVKESPITPILLMDEADSIICLRKEAATSSIDKMENSLQSILLSEFSSLDKGIIIATTNLAQNFDPAFERRFISKVHFTKPGPKILKHLWRVAINNLSETEAELLATEYNGMTGAEIDNVRRRSLTQYILNGTEPTLDNLRALCQTEKIVSQNNHIGF